MNRNGMNRAFLRPQLGACGRRRRSKTRQINDSMVGSRRLELPTSSVSRNNRPFPCNTHLVSNSFHISRTARLSGGATRIGR